MQNKGTDYIRRLLKDKTRLKRWRKMILCLSCVVVFCTVYALILPAITLERKTVCGQEEHSHTEECYSSDGQLTCGKQNTHIPNRVMQMIRHWKINQGKIHSRHRSRIRDKVRSRIKIRARIRVKVRIRFRCRMMEM